MTPKVTPERGLNSVSPLMPATSKRRPAALTWRPRRNSLSDSVPRGAVPPRVLARPLTSRGDVDGLVDAEDAAEAVEQHVVLREETRRRGVDAEAEVAEGVQPPVAPELFADEDDAEGVRLVDADAARLVRVRQLDPELEAERRPAPRLVAQLDLGREAEVAGVVRRVGARRDVERDGAPACAC